MPTADGCLMPLKAHGFGTSAILSGLEWSHLGYSTNIAWGNSNHLGLLPSLEGLSRIPLDAWTLGTACELYPSSWPLLSPCFSPWCSQTVGDRFRIREAA